MKDSSSKKEDLSTYVDKPTSLDSSGGKKDKPGKTKKTSSTSLDKSGGKKDKVFKIKIADLLNETGRQDEIVFEHNFSDQLPNVDAEGVTGTFTIQSLDNTSLLGTLSDIHASFHEVCDSCGATFLRSVDVPLYTGRFVFEDEVKKKEAPESEEVLFYIDSKSETINIEDMVVQAILLNDPFVKRCDACTKRLASIDDDEEDLGEFEAKGNIIFS